jgi:glycine cleavage system H protein
MANRKFTEEHEWISVDGDLATVGISDYAQEQLGDVVYIELPDPGRRVEKGGEAAVVESVKAAAEVYAPVAGEVTQANAALADDPSQLNADAEGAGWIFKMKLADPSQLDGLMDADAYAAYIDGLG